MQIFFVSIRTAKIYGPGQLLELQQLQAHRAHLSVQWPSELLLDEWEGYAVVVPEKEQVWGACHPSLEDGCLSAEFDFFPQPIPPQDKKIFVNMAQTQDIAVDVSEAD